MTLLAPDPTTEPLSDLTMFPPRASTAAAGAVTVPVEFFAALGTAIADANGSGASLSADVVRDAGYHAGQALYTRFAHWLATRGDGADVDPASLPDDEFGTRAGEFFGESGWGAFRMTPVSEAVMAIEAELWGEQDRGVGRLVSTGLLAGFFGRVADAPIAVLEVASEHPEACRFLLGSMDVLGYIHEAQERGVGWESAARSAV